MTLFKNSKYIYVFILSFILVSLYGANHKFYVSISQIDLNRDSMSLEVSIRLFTHDLSDAILETKGKKLLLGSEKQHPDTNDIIMDYLTGNFEIRQNDEKSTLKLLGFELENDIMWLYVEAPMVENLRVLELSNKIIMDLYSEQKNILNVRDNKKTESQICSKAKPVHKFRFNP